MYKDSVPRQVCYDMIRIHVWLGLIVMCDHTTNHNHNHLLLLHLLLSSWSLNEDIGGGGGGQNLVIDKI